MIKTFIEYLLTQTHSLTDGQFLGAAFLLGSIAGLLLAEALYRIMLALFHENSLPSRLNNIERNHRR